MTVSTAELRVILDKADQFDKIISIIQKNRKNGELCCSFCHKKQSEVAKLVAGPSVYICNDCVNLCSEIINEELFEVLTDGEGI